MEWADEEFQGLIIIARACLNCKIVKFFLEFYNGGCPNCERFMKFKNSMERITSCSTVFFNNLQILPEGCTVWGARLRPVENFAFGLYALHVYGIIPYRFLCELQCEERSDTGEHCL